MLTLKPSLISSRQEETAERKMAGGQQQFFLNHNEGTETHHHKVNRSNQSEKAERGSQQHNSRFRLRTKATNYSSPGIGSKSLSSFRTNRKELLTEGCDVQESFCSATAGEALNTGSSPPHVHTEVTRRDKPGPTRYCDPPPCPQRSPEQRPELSPEDTLTPEKHW